MAEPRIWKWWWRDKRDGRTGMYYARSDGLQTTDDVAQFAATYRNLSFVDCKEYNEQSQIDPKTQLATGGRAVDPEHYMAGTLAELRQDVERYLRSIGRWSGRTTRPSDLAHAAREVARSQPPPAPARPVYRTRFIPFSK